MKKNTLFLLLTGLFLASGSMQGQSLKDLLNSSAVKEVISTVTNSSISATDLQGVWNYQKPACELKSSNIIKEAGGSLLSSQMEKKMEEICTRAGIKEGNFSYTFNADSTFSNTLPKGKPLNGTYSYNPEDQTLSLHYALGKKLTITTLEAKITPAGDNMNLLFNADKLMQLLTLVSSATNLTTLKTINQIASQYDGIMLGFELKPHEK